MLAYQFVAGLKPNLKSKPAGVEGTFDQLLVKELLVRSAHVIRRVLGATIAMVLHTFRTAQCKAELPRKSRGEGTLKLHQKGLQPWWQLMS